MKSKFTIAFIVLSLTASISFAQLKVVIMGSSTAYGVGASTYANAWVGRTESYFNSNPSDGIDTTIYNIAYPGYDTYQEMPDDFVPPSGRPMPDMDYNVTKALSYYPDVVIINLPSNDISYGYSKAEMISNLRYMSALVFATGARCYVTTPQPRNDFLEDYADSLRSMIDSVNNSFGAYAVNFWDCLVTHDGLNQLRPEFQAPSSPAHLNDDGHYELFQIILNSYIFGQAGPVALQLTGFNGQLQNNSVLIKWHTEQQAPHTSFELQRSQDGISFETFFSQTITEARPAYNYSAIDQTPFAGKNFYRIKVTEPGRQFYSSIINLTSKGNALNISKLYVANGGSGLNVQLDIQKSQFLHISIMGSTGAILYNQKTFINQPTESITIPVGTLPSGQYYFRAIATDGTKIIRAFTK